MKVSNESNMLVDCLISKNEIQAQVNYDHRDHPRFDNLQELWAIRESIPVCLMEMSRTPSSSVKKLYKYDVSLPSVHQILNFAEGVRQSLVDAGYSVEEQSSGGQAAFRLYGFGHLGDGNLHLNILMKY